MNRAIRFLPKLLEMRALGIVEKGEIIARVLDAITPQDVDIVLGALPEEVLRGDDGLIRFVENFDPTAEYISFDLPIVAHDKVKLAEAWIKARNTSQP